MPLSLKDLKGGQGEEPQPTREAKPRKAKEPVPPAPVEEPDGQAYAFDGSETPETLAWLAEHSTDRATRRRAASRLQGGRGHGGD